MKLTDAFPQHLAALLLTNKPAKSSLAPAQAFGGAVKPPNPPALLTLAMVREHYVPLGTRTIFRMISKGTFPKADMVLGGKIRLWLKETVEAWINENRRK